MKPLVKAPKPAAAKTTVKKPAMPVAPPADTSTSRSVVAMLIGVILVGALGAFVFGNERSDVMLAVSREARGVTSLQAMDTPNIGSEALLNWCKLAVSEIFTYNFNDISPRILAAQRFFTDEGWKGFILAMGDQQVLQQVQAQRQFVSTIPSADAVVAEEGEKSGVYTWDVQMTIVTSVYTGNVAIKNDQLAIKVARIPTRKSDAGYPFGIVQIMR